MKIAMEGYVSQQQSHQKTIDNIGVFANNATKRMGCPPIHQIKILHTNRRKATQTSCEDKRAPRYNAQPSRWDRSAASAAESAAESAAGSAAGSACPASFPDLKLSPSTSTSPGHSAPLLRLPESFFSSAVWASAHPRAGRASAPIPPCSSSIGRLLASQ